MARTTSLAKNTPKAVAVRKAPVKPIPGKSATQARVSESEREAMIRDAAYYKAAQSGFDGDCMAHWLAAEREIDKKLNGG